MGIDVKQSSRITQTRFALAEGIHPASDRRHALPDVEGEALHKSGTLNLSGFVAA